MKKLLFLFFCFCSFFGAVRIVFAEKTLDYDIEAGDIYSSLDEVYYYPWLSGTFPVHSNTFAYLDKEGNLLEAYYATNYFYIESKGGQYLSDYVFKVGTEGKDLYPKVITDNDYVIGYEYYEDYLLYSSDFDVNSIEQWKVVQGYSDYYVSSFCSDYSIVSDTSFCLSNGSADYMSVIVFQEYVPANFELKCEPKEVKKGETSDCNLVVSAKEEINEITIPVTSELFVFDEYTEVEGWTLVKNDDGTITITSENGFVGEGVVLGATVTFKEDLVDDVDIELNGIKYTTGEGIELNSSAKDSVTIYEEPEVEEPKVDEDVKEKNPKTSDFVSIIFLMFLLALLVGIRFYKIINN